jgi:hypothetical protein
VVISAIAAAVSETNIPIVVIHTGGVHSYHIDTLSLTLALTVASAGEQNRLVVSGAKPTLAVLTDNLQTR